MEDYTSDTFDIVPTHLAVQAMRDNGYKNAAYAIAELMDNAVQAGASVVELMCAERTGQVKERSRTRVEQIAVLDNGYGMDADTLRLAMQFGNGTRLESGKQDGIGRFGMGLPASSISQCTRVDVWTWQNGTGSALHTYLDLDEIKTRRQSSVPRPQSGTVPELWRKMGNSFGASGTLVVWSNLDRCIWRTAGAIIDNSELVVGRMYRKWLDDGRVRIRFTTFNVDTGVLFEGKALPNDPGYLMAHTSCPALYDDTPMFEPLKDAEGLPDTEKVFQVEFRGETHPVRVKFSLAKPEARNAPNVGAIAYGKHAKGNVGVSVMRAERELELDQSLVIQYDTRERWWGVEVDFSPALDDLFGVTNNKQSARNFADLAKNDLEALLKNTTLNRALEELRDNDDPRGPLLAILYDINNHIARMRAQIKEQTAGARTLALAASGVLAPEQEATARTKQRQEAGHRGSSDRDEALPQETKRENAEQALRDIGLPTEMAHSLAANIISDNLKYRFVPGDLGSAAFFQVKTRGTGSIIIALNTQHPVYDSLIEVLEESTSGVSPDDLRRRLNGARDGLKTLLIAWARYEDELPEGLRRQAAQNTRDDWGRVARDFLTQDD